VAHLNVARLVYAIAVAALVTVYYTFETMRPAAVATIGAPSIAAIALGLVRLRPRRQAAWLLIATAVGLNTVGAVIFTVLAQTTAGPVAYPGPPDVFYLASYLPPALGLLWLGRPRLASWDWPVILDTAGLSLAGSLLVWIQLIHPALTSLNLTGAEKATAFASWAGYIAVLAALTRMALV
jgi:hypothetical protein